jgi:hypothetical protein
VKIFSFFRSEFRHKNADVTEDVKFVVVVHRLFTIIQCNKTLDRTLSSELALGKMETISINSRRDISRANRIGIFLPFVTVYIEQMFSVIKAGTSIVSTPQGYPSLTRMANIVEHVCLFLFLIIPSQRDRA